MSALTIAVMNACPASYTAAPAVVFRVRIDDPTGGRVHAMLLRSQILIEPRRRRYLPDEQERLFELFGDAAEWPRALNPVTWAQVPLVVPSFERSIDVELQVPCTYDLDIASAKYLHALREGDVPLCFLFSGTMFRVEQGRLQIEPISWSLEAAYRLPASVWQATMDQFFPGGGWLRLQRETIDRLQAFRGQQAAITWDEAIDALLQRASSHLPI
jgi:hypothetical protein